MATEEFPSELDSDTLRRVLQEASQHLRAHRAKLNAINVYPVPDGDTGSNMAATFDEAVAGIATWKRTPAWVTCCRSLRQHCTGRGAIPESDSFASAAGTCRRHARQTIAGC